jgi:DnaJ-class molecular chaperone
MSDSEQKQLESLPALETVCERCGGKGGREEVREWHDCYRCNGAGHVPTEFGELVLALIRHNLRLDRGLGSWR